MSVELNLILEIEKYSLLYNYKIPEYSRKNFTDKAWGEVASKVNLSVNDCKEKWRNIRSSFLRSLKCPQSGSGSKARKPYYLADYLSFILPYMKPSNTLENSGNLPQTERETTFSPEATDIFDNVSRTADINTQNETAASTPIPTTTKLKASAESQSYSVGRKRRRQIPDVDKTFVEYLRNKMEKKERAEGTLHKHCKCDSLIKERNPMSLFLMSLLPEFNTMNDEQIRSFKIKAMILIDNIKKTNMSSDMNTLEPTTTAVRTEPSYKFSFDESSS